MKWKYLNGPLVSRSISVSRIVFAYPKLSIFRQILNHFPSTTFSARLGIRKGNALASRHALLLSSPFPISKTSLVCPPSTLKFLCGMPYVASVPKPEVFLQGPLLQASFEGNYVPSGPSEPTRLFALSFLSLPISLVTHMIFTEFPTENLVIAFLII